MDWTSPYTGLPVVIQVLFWLALGLVVVSFLNVVVLYVNARRQRHRRLPRADEAEHLWVFLVPALNEQVTIADSVGRLALSNATHKVILVIDDGSDDATPDVLAEMTVPGLEVLRRELPEARLGKAAALNDAWRRVHAMLRQPAYARWRPQDVVVVVIDADGRLAPEAPPLLARHFADPLMGGVQSLVRIYNRRGWLTWAQDVEFAVFGWVYQLGRTRWGTANMGGNGQANRLAALDSVAEAAGPWRDRLTEDQDVGVRLLQRGWRGAQDVRCVVEQQGVSNLRRLYRQRTRWSQGAWESLRLLSGTGRLRSTVAARIDAWWYLLTPLVQTIVGIAFVTAIVLATTLQVALYSTTTFMLVLFIIIAVGPGLLGLAGRGRGLSGLATALLLIVPFTIYSWLIFPVVARAGVRALTGRSVWAKTAREPLDGEVHTQVEPDV